MLCIEFHLPPTDNLFWFHVLCSQLGMKLPFQCQSSILDFTCAGVETLNAVAKSLIKNCNTAGTVHTIKTMKSS